MTDPCKKIMEEAAAGRLTKDQVEDLRQALTKRMREIRARAKITEHQEAALKAAEEVANNVKLAAVIQKRDEAINIAAKENLRDYALAYFPQRPEKGIEAQLVGIASAKPGTRRSAWAEQVALSDKYANDLIRDLREGGVLELFATGTMDRDVARALWALSDGKGAEKTLAQLPKEAVAIGRALHAAQEAARVDANKAGAWIRNLKGYIVRQSHDMVKIRKAGYDRWRQVVLPRLDLERTIASLADGDVEKYLTAVYNDLASGVHLKAEALVELPGFSGSTVNVAKKVSQSRVLYFKDADGWFDYNQQFGVGHLREAAIAGLDRLARSTALMRKLGTNPRANLDQVIDNLVDVTTDPKVRSRLNENNTRRRLVDSMLGHLDGSARIPGSATAAQVFIGLRAIKTMSALGGSVLSSVTDLAVMAANTRFQGRGLLSGMSEGLAAIASGRSPERMQILNSIGVVLESQTGALLSRFSPDDAQPGWTSRWLRRYFKLNLQEWWTESLQTGAAIGHSNYLAQMSGRRFDELSADLKRVLGTYDIDPARWDLLRQSVEEGADGNKYLTPEALGQVTDEQLQAYLRSRGDTINDAAVTNLRDELDSQIRVYIQDQTAYSVLEPDAKVRSFTLGADQPGTFSGELRRLIWQFKSFAVSLTQRTLAREVYGRGADTFGEALRNKNGELAGIAQFMLVSTVLGYGAMVAKDFVKGRTPRDPSDPKTWQAALLQGGGLGLYGDFLLGESNRYGRSLIETMAGPVPSMISDLDEIRARLISGEDVAATSFRFAIANTPFLNLFYTRAALDYLLIYRIQESLNPGYLRRMERRVERENSQTFIIRPSEVVE